MNEGRARRSLLLVAPLRAGKAEAWRRFCQGLAAADVAEYAAAHRQLGIGDEQVWLLHTAYGELAVVAIDAAEPTEALRALANSAAPFDCWFKGQLLDLCGLDLAQPTFCFPAERLLAWEVSEARGP